MAAGEWALTAKGRAHGDRSCGTGSEEEQTSDRLARARAQAERE
jgi:hypothetical protein